MSTDLLRPLRVADAAGQELEIEQALEAKDFPGLQSTLFATNEGENFYVRMRAKFSRDSQNNEVLNLSLEGSLSIACQRCLDEMKIALKHNKQYVFVATDIDAEALTGAEADTFVLATQESERELRTGELDLAAMIAEEMMLAIPFYPRHENEQDCCSSDWKNYSSEPENTDTKSADDVQTPFADLKDLMKH
jgi:uncharacterized protein